MDSGAALLAALIGTALADGGVMARDDAGRSLTIYEAEYTTRFLGSDGRV